ncbi:MAG TPA: hypothetical protein VN789_11710 [Casimicrobiaceae bacterium]|nr:hypothetical protein [Casimicrobiaceae bacterium]
MLVAACTSMLPNSGGGMMRSITDPQYCPDSPGVCTIDVDVDPDAQCDDACANLGPFVIYVAPDASGDLKMVWRIVRTSNATFTSDGIRFQDPRFKCDRSQSGAPGDAGISGDGRSYICYNPHIKNATGWKYAIKIKPAAGPRQSVDPWVVNR